MLQQLPFLNQVNSIILLAIFAYMSLTHHFLKIIFYLRIFTVLLLIGISLVLGINSRMRYKCQIDEHLLMG